MGVRTDQLGGDFRGFTQSVASAVLQRSQIFYYGDDEAEVVEIPGEGLESLFSC